MIYATITSLVFILAMAYVVLALANKESGNMKLAGQILAALIAIVALVVLLYGVTGKGGCPMMGKGGMMGGMMGGKGMTMSEGHGATKSEAMMNMMKKDPSMMDDMCKNPEMRKMMQKAMNKTAK